MLNNAYFFSAINNVNNVIHIYATNTQVLKFNMRFLSIHAINLYNKILNRKSLNKTFERKLSNFIMRA